MSVDDRQFIEELYKSNRDKMFRYAYRLVGRIERAEELVQEVFVLALLHESELKSHPKPQSWLFVTLKYQIMNEWRRRDTSSEVPLDELLPLAAEPAREPLETVLPKELSGSERQILIWRFEEQIDYKEMSERLGITQSACRVRVSRAIGKCRKLWDKSD